MLVPKKQSKKNHQCSFELIVCNINRTTLKNLYIIYPSQYITVIVNTTFIMIFNHLGIPLSLISLYITFTSFLFKQSAIIFLYDTRSNYLFLIKEKPLKLPFLSSWLQRVDLNHHSLGYEPNETPFLHSAFWRQV